MAESIGITGCEKQCFRPATKTIGWVGMGKDKYMLKLMGTEDARHQGHGVMNEENLYLRSVPREEVANVTEELFKFYVANRAPDEEMGYFHRRVGMPAIIDYLKKNPKTAHLMEKTFPPLHLPPPQMGLED